MDIWKFENLKSFKSAIIFAFWATQGYASPLFDDNSMLAIELHGPRQDLIKERKREKEWPYKLSTEASTHKVQLRARGNSRLRVCTLPPLRIEFDGVDNRQTVFAGLEKLKLVMPCRRGDAAQVNVFQEYLAYRIFNLVTDHSYRVRLLQTTFVESKDDKDSENEVSFGFAIEPRQALADRVDGDAVNVPGVSLASLNRQHMARVYIFQYLIGNTDWSLVTAEGDEVCCHNGEILDINQDRFYIPYDFDLSGLVNASYAYPAPSLRIRKVTQRLYRGFCMPREELQTALAAIKRKKSAIFLELKNLPGVQEKEQKKTRKFLEDFFEDAEDEQELLNYFERRCL